MARKRQVVPSKEDLIAKIKTLQAEYKEDPKCRVLIARSLNQSGITTQTGRDWNSGRLSQFIRANIPELVDKAKAKYAADDSKAAAHENKASPKKKAAPEKKVAPETEVVESGPENREVLSPDRVSALKEEIRTMVEESMEATREESRASMEKLLLEVKSSVAAELKQDVVALTQETGKLLNTEITTASEEYDHRLESRMTQFKIGLDKTLEDFRTEMQTLVREEVHKALADSSSNGGRVQAEALDVQPPKEEIESLVKQQVESAIKDHKLAGADRRAPGEFLPAARFVEVIESNVIWWMKSLLKPKK